MVVEIAADSYVYDEERFSSMESDLVESLRGMLHGAEGPDIAAVTVPWDSEYARIGHMSESRAYKGYDNYTAMIPHERRSVWLYTVDTSLGAIEHVKRLVTPLDSQARALTGLTGIEVVDDRLVAEDLRERADLASVLSFHGIRSLDQCWNVTSNHVTHRGSQDPLRIAQNTLKSYKATYLLAMDAGLGHLFAYLNRQAIRSLSRLGVDYCYLLNEEFHLPDPDSPGEYDRHYRAVAIANNPQNEAAFTVPYPYETPEDGAPDKRRQLRAYLSSIAVESVPVLALVDRECTGGPHLEPRL